MKYAFPIFITFFLFSCDTKKKNDDQISDEIYKKIEYPEDNIWKVKLYVKAECRIRVKDSLTTLPDLCSVIFTCYRNYCINEEKNPSYEVEIIGEENVKMECINAIKNELRECDLLKVRYKVREKLSE